MVACRARSCLASKGKIRRIDSFRRPRRTTPCHEAHATQTGSFRAPSASARLLMPVGTSSTRIDPMSSSNGNGGEPRPGSVTPTKPTSKQMKKSLLTDQDAGGFDDHEMSPMPMRSDEVAEENGGGGGHGGSTEDMQVDIDESLLMTDEHGLSDNEAEQRLLKFGRNELPDVRVPKWKIFLSHFTGIMPGMIIAAICIEGILAEWPDLRCSPASSF